MHHDPGLLTTSTNRNLFQPTSDYKKRRRTELRKSIHKGKTRSTSQSQERPEGGIEAKLRRDLSPASADSNSKQDDLVDLVVEDYEAEEAERVRARKEGGDAWNRSQQKHFVRTYSGAGDELGEDIREGFDPGQISADYPPPEHAVSDDDEEQSGEGSGSSKGRYESMMGEQNVWDSPVTPKDA